MRNRLPIPLPNLAPALMALMLAGIAGSGHDTGPAPLGGALQRAVAAADNDDSLAVWVFFRDRDLSPAERAAALAGAADALPERTLQRRARAQAPGTALVDDRDLPLAPGYLARVEAAGGRLRRTSRWLNAASFDVPVGRIDRIARLDCVRRLDRVARFERAAIPRPIPVPEGELPLAAPQKDTAWTLDYGPNLAAMEQVNVPPAHELGLTGAGVILGMLDTGFHVGHESLAGLTVLGAYDFVDGDAQVDLEAGDDSSEISHGTKTLSTVAGYAPGHLVAPAFGVSVLLAKTEDATQEVPIEEDNWVAGVEWLEANGADLASSSLGYIDWYTQADLDGGTCVTTIAADQAVGRGLLIVNSAGNERSSAWGTLVAPADADSILTVAAVYADGTVTYFSSPGPTADGRIKPDVAALGYVNPVANPYDDAAYTVASGTSLSCPVVAGVAALVLERTPQLTPMQVHRALKATATQADAPDTNLGWGIVDALAAIEYFGPKFVHAPLPATGDETGPYLVAAGITDVDAVAYAEVVYRVNHGAWQALPMSPLGGGQYTADIPGQTASAVVDYYLQAVGTAGVTRRSPDPLWTGDEFYSFAVTHSSGLGDEVAAAVTALRGASPNPFNPRTTISFTLAHEGPARLEVFDARGHLVRGLLAATLEAGRHRTVWDGRDESGLELGSGVYLYRLQADGAALTGKMVLVR